MSSDLNRTILIGRLVRDPEMRYTNSGIPVASFSLANNRSYTQNGEKKETTSFFNCIGWSKLGEHIVQYCKKGDRVGVEGRLQQRSWEDPQGNKRSTVEIVAENIQFLNDTNTATNSAANNEKQGGLYDNVNQGSLNSIPETLPFSDDIPF